LIKSLMIGMGLPIVSSAADGVEVLEGSGLPNLALGRWLLRKPAGLL